MNKKYDVIFLGLAKNVASTINLFFDSIRRIYKSNLKENTWFWNAHRIVACFSIELRNKLESILNLLVQICNESHMNILMNSNQIKIT